MKRIGALFGALSLLATGCGAETPKATTLTDDNVEFAPIATTDVDLQPLVEASHHVGLTLARQDGNAVTSPLSFVLTLAMLGEGATNAGEQEIAALLGPDRSRASAALISALAAYEGDVFDVDEKAPPEKPVVHIANRAVVDTEQPVSAQFLSRVRQFHDSEVAATDLSEPSASRIFDEWVKEQTGGLIEKSGIEPRPDLVLVLQNAAVFAASWHVPFRPEKTSDEPFSLADGSEVTTAMMHAEWDLPYAEVAGWRAIRLAYTEGFSADFILPPQGSDPADLDEEALAEITKTLGADRAQFVRLSLPKVDLAGSIDLMDTLQRLGLGSLSDPKAQPLEDILPDAILGQAVQQAMLRIDEQGTIAAAVTEMGVETMSAPMPAKEMCFDHPYLVVIHHDDTGMPLFLAAIRDPAARQ